MKNMNNDERLMSNAIAYAKQGSTPFGCVIADGDQIVSGAFNTVKSGKDPTAHAEVNAIRQLPPKYFGSATQLTLYTTCEPCPMCMGAIIFAGIGRVVYGVAIEDISLYFNQINIPAAEVADRGFGKIVVADNVLPAECLALLKKISG